MVKFRASIAVSIALWSFAAAGADAQDAPKRKPGLWQQTVTTSSGPAMPPQTMSMCSDEKTDSLIAEQAGTNQRCTQQSIKRQGNAYLVEAVCKDGATTIRTQGRFTGDFMSSYSG